ncbi:MAG: sulfatase-like hydrolase/transferase [Rikenellaceae bacterium]
MNTYIKLSAIALSLVAAKSAEAKKPTNVIFVLADDYSCGEHGIYGNKEIQTPHLDKLAQESARFENFYVAPTSSPTRAQLMSGKHEFRVGVTHTTNPRCFLKVGSNFSFLLQNLGQEPVTS